MNSEKMREMIKLHDDLILSQNIPGLLRRGSPVVWFKPWTKYYGVCFDQDSLGWRAIRNYENEIYYCKDSYLDLTDETGRAHAAWWISENGPDEWCMRPGIRPGKYAHAEQDGVHGWFFVGDHGGFHLKAWREEKQKGWKWLDIDPYDDRRLKDGSRWVDAEMLRRVVLYIAENKDD